MMARGGESLEAGKSSTGQPRVADRLGAIVRTERGEAPQTLYLCKLEPRANAEPLFVGVIGRVVPCNEMGGTQDLLADRTFYRFLPNIGGHKGSRKVWPSANACIPSWTKNYGFLRLLDPEECHEAQAKAGGR